MLKLDLRVGESVCIGPDVCLVLEEKTGQLARLAISAPRSMQILRHRKDPYLEGPESDDPKQQIIELVKQQNT